MVERFTPHRYIPVDENHRIMVAVDTKDPKWNSVFLPEYRSESTWVNYLRKGVLVVSESERGARAYIAYALKHLES